MPQDLVHIQPGDTLVIYRDSSNDHDACQRTVTFVAGRWISVDGEQTRFDRATGENSGRYIYPQAFTVEQWQDRKRRQGLINALSAQGIEVTPRCVLSTPQLKAMYDIATGEGNSPL